MDTLTDPYGHPKGIDHFHVAFGPQLAKTPEGRLVARVVGWRDGRPQLILLQGELATFARDHLAPGRQIVVRGLFSNEDKPDHVRSWDVHAQEVHLVGSYEANASTRERPPVLRDHIINSSFSTDQNRELFHALHEAAIDCTIAEDARGRHPYSEIIRYAERGLTPPQFVNKDIHPDVWSLVSGRVLNLRESEVPKLLDDCRRAFGTKDLDGIVKLRLHDRFAAIERSIDLPDLAAKRLGYTVLSRSADGRTATMKHEQRDTSITLERHERGYWRANTRISATDLVAHALRTTPSHARQLLTDWQREQAVHRSLSVPTRRRSSQLER